MSTISDEHLKHLKEVREIAIVALFIMGSGMGFHQNVISGIGIVTFVGALVFDRIGDKRIDRLKNINEALQEGLEYLPMRSKGPEVEAAVIKWDGHVKNLSKFTEELRSFVQEDRFEDGMKSLARITEEIYNKSRKFNDFSENNMLLSWTRDLHFREVDLDRKKVGKGLCRMVMDFDDKYFRTRVLEVGHECGVLGEMVEEAQKRGRRGKETKEMIGAFLKKIEITAKVPDQKIEVGDSFKGDGRTPNNK